MRGMMSKVELERLGLFHSGDVAAGISAFDGHIPFELVVLDMTSIKPENYEVVTENLRKNLTFIGSRVLVLMENYSGIPDKLKELENKRICSICCKDQICVALNRKAQELYYGILRYEWLKKRYGDDTWGIYINLGEQEKSSLVSEWCKIKNDVNDILKGIIINIDYTTNDNESNLKGLKCLPEHSLIFDRHAQFIRFKNIGSELGPKLEPLINSLGFKGYYDTWGINSPLYLVLFNPPKSLSGQIDLIIDLLESALFRILVVDERIGEKVFVRSSDEHFKTLAAMKIFTVTHVADEQIGKNIPKQGFNLEINNDNLTICWNNVTYDKFDFLIIHQGVLENKDIREIIAKQLNVELNSGNLKKDLEQLIDEIYKYIPFIVIDSGRGRPANMPDNAKFFSFSALQDNVLRKNPSKYGLVQMLLRLTGRR